ncbi:hydrolase [Bacillus sp. V3B]|uniref:hydrolase n=1 Tax=Bacillus sp. V3B TaxID=2804915 RepID=UPI00210C688A|nr:hydrolase [Bacillus sp. V3B]MCQ6274461.1 hydrolase [Bacillus sp. V3B]
MDEKKTYYIEIAAGEISQSATSSPWNFKIEATDREIHALRDYFDRSESNELNNFLRAHIPFREYHHDPENDAYDETLKQVYHLIYQLGDSEAKEQIKNMGILADDLK